MCDFTDWVPCITCSRKAPALAVSYVTVKLPSPLSRAATLKTPAPSASATRGVPDGGAATARSEKAYEFVSVHPSVASSSTAVTRTEKREVPFGTRRPATSFRNSTKAVGSPARAARRPAPSASHWPASTGACFATSVNGEPKICTPFLPPRTWTL